RLAFRLIRIPIQCPLRKLASGAFWLRLNEQHGMGNRSGETPMLQKMNSHKYLCHAVGLWNLWLHGKNL
ncbi:MAG: hypothetical protein ACPGJU_07165, partial [Coraliomargarita sp.]